MKTSFTVVRTRSGWLIPTVIVCLALAAFSFAALPARAGAAEEKAKKAFADWKAAQAAVAAAQEKLADAQKKLQTAMAAVAKSGGKATPEQEAALAGGRAEVARAEAALREAEKQELAARVALEAAIADLPDGPLKDQLKRERNYPSLVAANGLYTVKFDTPSGQLKVNLPDDMRAGDTISGTVVPEPNGSTDEERKTNRGTLEGYVVEISGQKFSVKQGSVGPFVIRQLQPPGGLGRPPMPPPPDSFFDVFVGVDPPNGPTTTRARIHLVSFYPGPPPHPSGAIITPDPKMSQPTHPSGAIITPDPKITQPTHPSGAIITPDPKMSQPTHTSGAIITPDPKITEPKPPAGGITTITGGGFDSKPQDLDMVPGFNIPPLGQQGRNVIITGPFDGDSSNTSFRRDIEKNPENVSAGFGLLAESPRKAVFQSPTDVTGQTEVTVRDGDKQTTGNFRNLGIKLSAPKTSLMKGESTELKVEVQGLEGIKQSVPLTIASQGVITMTGGNYQPLTIQPAEVGADGSYSTTRGITGLQAGGWTATATVVTGRFNVCLQDDARPTTTILLNTVTGGYSIPLPGGSSLAQTGDAPSIGEATVVMKGCILTLRDDKPTRGVLVRLDTCTNAGSAAVETANKQKFTITDRNISDNTCVSAP